ncbi:MAG: phosphodiester glycosidase family protein [Desulfosporosinus sp.]|nr:phosphodiester glycosidase family protein [Desulfosporosinus sp.]MDA8220645.1 phosphodiester glycosidase family protein [Desulfitobacterium hafniense]
MIEHVEGKAILTAESAVTETPSNVESDDWNYKSDNVTINIEKVQTGQGKDMVTYFVADVQMSDASSLKSAFAKNIFGRNVVEKTSQIAADNQAIFAVNGDYYGFRSDGVLIRNGVLYRDEPARVGAALFEDGTMQTFDETEVASSSLLAAGALHTLSFGPVLIKNSEIVEDFEKVSIDSNFGNRSIQGSNPRTGIGMISANHYVFVVVDGRKENYSKGMTLSEFTDVFADLGCTEAYNLDGGGSSTMYFMGRVVNNPLGKQDERSISDILYIEG